MSPLSELQRRASTDNTGRLIFPFFTKPSRAIIATYFPLPLARTLSGKKLRLPVAQAPAHIEVSGRASIAAIPRSIRRVMISRWRC
jgi:hypothetical protein